MRISTPFCFLIFLLLNFLPESLSAQDTLRYKSGFSEAVTILEIDTISGGTVKFKRMPPDETIYIFLIHEIEWIVMSNGIQISCNHFDFEDEEVEVAEVLTKRRIMNYIPGNFLVVFYPVALIPLPGAANPNGIISLGARYENPRDKFAIDLTARIGIRPGELTNDYVSGQIFEVGISSMYNFHREMKCCFNLGAGFSAGTEYFNQSVWSYTGSYAYYAVRRGNIIRVFGRIGMRWNMTKQLTVITMLSLGVKKSTLSNYSGYWGTNAVFHFGLAYRFGSINK